MKCPNCGRENEHDEKLCKYCGTPLDESYTPPSYSVNMSPPPSERRRNKTRDGIRAIMFCLLLVMLLFGCQSCVVTGYTMSIMTSSPVYNVSSAEAVEQILTDIINATLENTTMILFIANLMTVLVVCMLFRLRRKEPRSEVSAYAVNPFRIPTFALFGASLNVFISITLSYLPIPDSLLEDFNSSYSGLSAFSSPAELIFSILSVAVVTGVAEEIVFRGAAMKRLIPVFGKTASVFITAAIFGLAHSTPIAIAYAFLVGILFGFMYISYGSVVPSLVCHIFFNMMSYIIPYAPEYTIIFIYIIASALLILLAYRIFVRHPIFADVVYDRDELITPINERERNIVSALRTKQKTGELDSDDMLELMEAWEENRSNVKNNHKKKG